MTVTLSFDAPHPMRGLLEAVKDPCSRDPASSAGNENLQQFANQSLPMLWDAAFHLHPGLTIRQSNLHWRNQRSAKARRTASQRSGISAHCEVQHSPVGLLRNPRFRRCSPSTRAQVKALEAGLERPTHSRTQPELDRFGDGDPFLRDPASSAGQRQH